MFNFERGTSNFQYGAEYRAKITLCQNDADHQLAIETEKLSREARTNCICQFMCSKSSISSAITQYIVALFP
jgi:hypothetical protein